MSKTIEYVLTATDTTKIKAEKALRKQVTAAKRKFGKGFGELDHLDLYVADAEIRGEPEKAHLTEGRFEGQDYESLVGKMEDAFNGQGYKIQEFTIKQTFIVPEDMYNAAEERKSPTAYGLPRNQTIMGDIVDRLTE